MKNSILDSLDRAIESAEGIIDLVEKRELAHLEHAESMAQAHADFVQGIERIFEDEPRPYYAVFFNAEGETVITSNGQINAEPLGEFESFIHATEHAQRLYPSNHIHFGVCLLKNQGKGLGGFKVIDCYDMQDLWDEVGDVA